jgi:hypothetical protein
MIMRSINVAVCPICGRDVARVFAAANGFAVACDIEAGGCGAESTAGRSEAWAIDNWNRCPNPSARALIAAHARRLAVADV